VGAASAFLTGTAKAASSGWQPDWAFCIFCNALWWADGSSLGACPGNDTGHGIATGDYNYTVNYGRSGLNNSSDPQPDWRWCNQCYGLFWGGNGGSCWGNRHGAGPHNAGITNYDLFWNSSGIDTQTNWRWCGNCSLIFWQGSSPTGTGSCAAAPSQGPHWDGSDTIYQMDWRGTF
jgi:hypothetical protein